MKPKRLTSEQIRAARALLRWSALDLAGASAVAANTIRRAEVAEGPTTLTAANDLAIRRTLEEVGRDFGVTRERIRQIESKTLAKLRHPSRAQMLREYLD